MRSRLPADVALAVVVAESRPDETEVGESIQKFETAGIDHHASVEQCHQFPFTTTGHGSGQVEGRRCAGPTGKNEVARRFELFVTFLQPAFQ